MPLYYLALDVGTTACKTALVEESGVLVAQARREQPVYFPHPTWMEADAEEWWAAAAATIREVLERSGIPPGAIAAVSLCGLKHALVPVDADGQPLLRVMLWPDLRCLPQWERLRQEPQFAPVANTTHAACRLLWLRENAPEVLARTYRFLLTKDFLRHRLCGGFATDLSDARGTQMVDRTTRQWDYPLFDALGIPRHTLPEILPATARAGGVTPAAAAATGLQAGTPVVIGSSDVFATIIATLGYLPGRTLLYIGTAAWMVHFPHDYPHSRDQAFADGEWSVQWLGACTSTGATWKWARGVWGAEGRGGKREEREWESGRVEGKAGAGQLAAACASPYAAMDAEAAQAPAGSEGVLFLPHLMGERALEFDPEARGMFAGLTLAHRRPHLLRAILEGNAYQLRRLLERFGPERIADVIISGGGANSSLWRKIIATVLNRRLLLPRITESGLLGAAMLAAVYAGQFANLGAASDAWIEFVDAQPPDPAWQAAYQEGYRRFCAWHRRPL